MTARARLTLAAFLGALLVVLGAAAAAAAPGAQPAGTVTFLAGDATREARGKAEALSVASAVFEGDVIQTGRRTRLEVKLADSSIVRLGPFSKALVEVASFGTSVEARKVSAKLIVGQVWANVAKAMGGEARFEVQTENAVAGVRGTTFRVDAHNDRSVVVKVYAGTVAVAAGPIPRPEHGGETGESSNTAASAPPAVPEQLAKAEQSSNAAAAEPKVMPGHVGGVGESAGAAPPKPKERKQIAGPSQVSREQWEKIVTSMMEVRVSSDGKPSEPQQFAMSAEDSWEAWNRERDATAR